MNYFFLEEDSSKAITLEFISCFHDWVPYIGFTHRDYFCTKCNEKLDWDAAECLIKFNNMYGNF